MGQINLYRIDDNKQSDFEDNIDCKFEFLGEQNYKYYENSGEQCTVVTYVNKIKNVKAPEWKWVLDEYEFDYQQSMESVRAILVIKIENVMYAVTFGMAYFAVDKFCDTKFAFDFARRIRFKQIKTTTLTTPNSQKNKTVNVYLNYNDIFYESGEAYAKIKAKADILINGKLCETTVEIGHSIKVRIPSNNIVGILQFIKMVEETLKKDEMQKIPVFQRLKDEAKINELDLRLSEKIESDIDCINISELDIIGVTEVFNNNDTCFELKYDRKKHKMVEQLTKENLLQFLEENNLSLKNDFLNIKVISYRDGNPVCTDIIKRLIDYTDDEEKCILLKGEWYYFNDDYIEYLEESINELDVIYDEKYDFGNVKLEEYQNQMVKKLEKDAEYERLSYSDIMAKIKKKYYAEGAFNNYVSEKYGFEMYDRELDHINGQKLELMDLYKDRTMYAVKIGESSAKLSYVVEQSITSLKMYKHRALKDMPEIDKVAVWLILKRKNHLKDKNGKPDLACLKMITLKNRLDEWKKEVRLMGYTPVIYLNYWD
ncbi:DUF6119 family protein [Agathobacter rectalis]|uniref:Sporadically distributed protein, TIGR04141 family n=1 Tax=Agathobacter rectalis TaxID=39491 RepID=A0A396FQK1_9FIRM|nr:DUF6119 family protein [Agathobacter rectalis]RGZ75196.1 hypothetical protein DW975_07630 [Agathobacter rectalis]RHL77202.1 hypothetical protein DW001_12350 [Agathobacter rectalis]